MTDTARILIERYGVLLTYAQLAEVLGRRSADGLRISLSRPHDEWLRRINDAKVRFGRRVMFRSSDIAQLIDAQCKAPQQ